MSTATTSAHVRSHIGRTAALGDIGDVFDDLEAERYVGRAVITDFGD